MKTKILLSFSVVLSLFVIYRITKMRTFTSEPEAKPTFAKYEGTDLARPTSYSTGGNPRYYDLQKGRI